MHFQTKPFSPPFIDDVVINEVLETILFLLSDAAKAITGQNIHVDNRII
jgi:enoyl-[acyl-carrier-protein] reductase (NADH)